MPDNVKKALESTDVSVIKRAFGMEEGQVTKYVDRIHAILKIYDENGSCNRESIYKVELREAVAGLRESFKRVETRVYKVHGGPNFFPTIQIWT